MSHNDRLLDLLVARATEGLPAGDANELAQALASQRELDVDDLDLAAAAVYLAYDAACAKTETMPGALKRRIPRPDTP